MKPGSFLSTQRYHILLIVFVAAIYWAGQVWHALPLRPQSLHISAQCDRASIARNFYEEDMNIFVPHINNLQRGTGIAAAEFPLIGFAAALCYKLFGFNEFWYRFIVMLCFSIGLVYAFRLAGLWLHSQTAALLVCLLWITSPTLLYYIPNFNPDPASLGLLMMAWYYFFELRNRFKFSGLLLFTMACSLALLLKASTAVSITAMCCLLLTDWFKLLSAERKSTFSNKFPLLVSIAISSALAFAWYRYASNLNEKYYSNYFTLESRLPQSWEQAKHIWAQMQERFLFHYYARVMLYCVVALHLIILLLHKYISRTLLLLTFLLAMGSIAFSAMMFVAYEDHDYYIIALLPWVFFLLLCMAVAATHVQIPVWIKHATWPAAVILLVYGTWYCHTTNRKLYDRSCCYEPLFDAFYDIEPLLREKGVRRDDKVVTMTEWAYNYSLYLMNVKGYAVSYRYDLNRVLYYVCTRQAKYVMLNADNCLPDVPVVKRFLGEPVLVHHNLKLYKPHVEDTALFNAIHKHMHRCMALLKKPMLNYGEWLQYNYGYSKATGIPMDAVLDDIGLYLYKVREDELNTKIQAFVEQQHLQNATVAEQKQAFIKANDLSEEDLLVLRVPYNDWFINF